jgi:hypothetical protein
MDFAILLFYNKFTHILEFFTLKKLNEVRTSFSSTQFQKLAIIKIKSSLL